MAVVTQIGRTDGVPLQDNANPELEVSVVIPCLNESENISEVVAGALKALHDNQLIGEVIVADNGSNDGSGALAVKAGAKVVDVRLRGYGAAYLGGFAACRGKYIVMADADLTYDFAELPAFVKPLRLGSDMVIGNRMNNIQPGAMPWLHRYVGNPVLSGALNLMFKTGVRDAHCGMRSIRRDRLNDLSLRTSGMEFASEMVIRASKAGLKIAQHEISYYPRGGESKLSTWRDGWRHLRFLLVHSPNHLFLWPGTMMLTVGLLAMALILSGLEITGRAWDVHSMVLASLLAIVGTQIVSLGLCAHAYGMYYMDDVDPWFDRMRERFRLEHGLVLGAAIALMGMTGVLVIIIDWITSGFGALSKSRLMVFSAALVVLGLQIVFSSFLLSVIGLRRHDNAERPQERQI